MAGRKVIRIGLDFDGVVTYNPLRVARVIVAFVKHRMLKIKKLGFFVPKNSWQRQLFKLVVILPSTFPANGINLLRNMSLSSRYEFYLITGRFDFAKENTLSWLKKYNLSEVFKKIYINEQNQQPHEFKKKLVNQLKFNYYIEDNWDVVKYLSEDKSLKTFWVYNILDKNKSYDYKFPDLKRALQSIFDNENIS